MRSGEEAPDENRQTELADDLRAQVSFNSYRQKTPFGIQHWIIIWNCDIAGFHLQVVDELLKRREETEW